MNISSLISLFSKRDLLPSSTEFLRFAQSVDFEKAYKVRAREFICRIKKEKNRRRDVARTVLSQYRSSENSDDAIACAYNREYDGEQNYAYLSPLLFREGFKIVTGLKVEDAPTLTILDVGAGSNEFLRFCHSELCIPKKQLIGTDVSTVSVERMRSDGYESHCGRLETLPLSKKMFDIVYLSYFVDYDTNQKRTFSSAIEFVRDGGIIVLEGWFPVRPFALLASDKNTYSFVTKGKNKYEDTMLIFECINSECEERGYVVQLERVCEGVRYVHSRYSLQKLRSWFMTMRVYKTA